MKCEVKTVNLTHTDKRCADFVLAVTCTSANSLKQPSGGISQKYELSDPTGENREAFLLRTCQIAKLKGMLRLAILDL